MGTSEIGHIKLLKGVVPLQFQQRNEPVLLKAFTVKDTSLSVFSSLNY